MTMRGHARPGQLVQFNTWGRTLSIYGALTREERVYVELADLMMYIKSVSKKESGLNEDVDVFLFGDIMVRTIAWRTDDMFRDWHACFGS